MTFLELKGEASLISGTEHMVMQLPMGGVSSVAKITIPSGFGLVPIIKKLPIVDLRGDDRTPRFREAIEFDSATPLEYVERWISANEVLKDCVRLGSIVKWRDGQVSFIIVQPEYPGEPATHAEIDRYFIQSRWTRIASVDGHSIFFNYAHQVLAFDAAPRNCFVFENQLQVFDVILCRPTDEMEAFLKLYD